ncbi:MAG: hypothetical protein K5869_10785 [Saccharofermentans sp.]|nr:hypothetical protein [Saccharofermentans sp.]
MLDSLKEKLMLPLIYAAAVITVASVAIFVFFSVSPSWLRFLPLILAAAGFAGGFALSFVPVFKDHKIIPVICISVAAVLTGVLIAVLL